jgi:hypothetical protein
MHLRSYILSPLSVRPGNLWLASVCFPHAVLLACALVQLATLLLRPAAYRRVRVRAHSLMRYLRCAVVTWNILGTGGASWWWRQHVLSGHPLRSLVAAVCVIPTLFLAVATANPCPVAASGPLACLMLFFYVAGFLSYAASIWELPALADHVQGVCAWTEVGALAAESAGLAAFGCASLGAASCRLRSCMRSFFVGCSLPCRGGGGWERLPAVWPRTTAAPDMGPAQSCAPLPSATPPTCGRWASPSLPAVASGGAAPRAQRCSCLVRRGCQWRGRVLGFLGAGDRGALKPPLPRGRSTHEAERV